MKRLKPLALLIAAICLAALCLFAQATTARASTSNYPETVTGIQVTPIYIPGAITATRTPIKFRVPSKMHVIGVSAYARVIDTSDGNETQTVDIQEAGTSILSSAISLAAQDTIYEGTISDKYIADEATVSIVLTLGGTTPSITDTTVTLIMRRTN